MSRVLGQEMSRVVPCSVISLQRSSIAARDAKKKKKKKTTFKVSKESIINRTRTETSLKQNIADPSNVLYFTKLPFFGTHGLHHPDG